jgi:hypothetical protein
MFYAWLGSLVLLGATPLAAQYLIDLETPVMRVAGVIVGVAGMVPWLAVSVAAVRRGDEYARRLYLISIGWVFCGALLLVVTLDWLVKAKFIGPPNLSLVWVGFLILWLLSFIVVRRRFEAGQ